MESPSYWKESNALAWNFMLVFFMQRLGIRSYRTS
jgi:hypothetical protein